MGELMKRDNQLPNFADRKPDKVDTYAGKSTARVSKIYNDPDGSTWKLTRKINKDGSISDKVEHRHP